MKWSKSEIRAARKLPLLLILRHRGFTLHELAGDNYRVGPYSDLFIKDCYWIWKSRNLHGNTIDFFVHVQNLSFSQAMDQILGTENHQTHVENPTNLPS